MKKILITGANSYIGISFENYINANYPEEYLVDTVDMIDGSWREKDFSGYDSVFHVAGIAHIKETKENSELYYKVNRDLAIETAAKAKAAGVGQFVFLSSMSVYGMDTGVITADTLPTPKSSYGKSKLQAEEGLAELVDENFKIAVVRPPMVYGKGCKGNYNLLSKIALKLPIFPNVDNKRSMIYIDNLSEFVKCIIKDSASGVFCPQNSEFVNTTKMAQEICQANGKRFRTTKILNWALNIGKTIVSALNKAFGSLTYEKEMSCYSSNYNVVDFRESIIMTENKK